MHKCKLFSQLIIKRSLILAPQMWVFLGFLFTVIVKLIWLSQQKKMIMNTRFNDQQKNKKFSFMTCFD